MPPLFRRGYARSGALLHLLRRLLRSVAFFASLRRFDAALRTLSSPPWSSTVQDLTYLALTFVLAISLIGLIAGCDALGARK